VDWMAPAEEGSSTDKMYEYGISSLVSDHSRVYKGGSWRDPAFYLSPAARRSLDEKMSTNYIGFRCAMGSVGGSSSGKK